MSAGNKGAKISCEGISAAEWVEIWEIIIINSLLVLNKLFICKRKNVLFLLIGVSHY